MSSCWGIAIRRISFSPKLLGECNFESPVFCLGLWVEKFWLMRLMIAGARSGFGSVMLGALMTRIRFRAPLV